VLSLEGFLMSIIIIAIAPFFGYLADVFSLTYALFIEGILILAVGVVLVVLIKASNKKI